MPWNAPIPAVSVPLERPYPGKGEALCGSCAYLTAPFSGAQGPTDSYNNCTANRSGTRSSLQSVQALLAFFSGSALFGSCFSL